MKQYVCDKCGSYVTKPEVVLKGITGTSGGILLPEQFHEKHFCSPGCFWKWIDLYNPKRSDEWILPKDSPHTKALLAELKKGPLEPGTIILVEEGP